MQFDQFVGNSAILKGKYEYALAGVNAEAGAHVNRWEKAPLYFTAGPYYLTGKGGSTWGGQIRASAQIFDYVKIEGNTSYDHLFKWIGQGQVGLSFSFGGKKKVLKEKNSNCSSSFLLAKRSYQPVDRFEIIPVDKKQGKSTAINPATGLPYQFIFVDNTSASLGTYESPYHSLASAEAQSSPYDIIYVFPGDGTTTNMDHGIALKPNQKLWGSAIEYTLPTTVGSVIIPNMSSSAPQITNIDLLGAGATLSTNNEIQGITFTQTSGQAIFGTDPITANISSCNFSGCGQGDLGIFPILLQASSPFVAAINNNSFTNNPNAGVLIKLLPGASSTQITMNNNQAYSNQVSSGGVGIMNVEGHGLVGDCNLVMRNNIYKNNDSGAVSIIDFDSPHEGSFSSFTGTFVANTFVENTQGITFGTNADTCNLLIQDNDLSNNTNGSIIILAGSAGVQSIHEATIVIDSNQINQGGSGGDAITISSAGDILSIEITNNSISDNIGTGLVSFFNQPGPNVTLSISNNVISNNLNAANFNASGGISLDGFGAITALIDSNTFNNNAQGNSIGSYGSSFMSTPDTSSVTFTNNQLTNDTFDFEFYGNAPATGCLTISGNTSTISPTYTFQQQGSGDCFIVPCSYETKNTGGFTLSGVTPSADCLGNACP